MKETKIEKENLLGNIPKYLSKAAIVIFIFSFIVIIYIGVYLLKKYK